MSADPPTLDRLRERVAAQQCLSCGGEPARLVRFEEVWSFVLVRKREEIEGFLCPACATRVARRELVRTSLLGWWGVPWVLVTPLDLWRQWRRLADVCGSRAVAWLHLPLVALVPALLALLVWWPSSGGAGADPFVEGSRLFYKERAYDRALPLLEAAVARDAGPERALTLGRCLLALGEHARAVAVLRGVLERSPGATSARRSLADALRAQGALGAAATELELLATSGERRVLARLASVLAELGREADARRWLDRALEQGDEPALRVQRARLHRDHGRPAEAAADFLAAAARRGADASSWIGFARQAGLNARLPEVRQELRGRLASAKGDARAAIELALAVIVRDPAKRLEALRAAARSASGPVVGPARLELARALEASGDREGALALVAPPASFSAALLAARLGGSVDWDRLGAPPPARWIGRAESARAAGARATLDLSAAAALTTSEQRVTRCRLARHAARVARERGDFALATRLLEGADEGLPGIHREAQLARRDRALVAIEAGAAASEIERLLGLAGEGPHVEIAQTCQLLRGLRAMLARDRRAAVAALTALARLPVERSTADPLPAVAARVLLGRVPPDALERVRALMGPRADGLVHLTRAVSLRRRGRGAEARAALEAGVAATAGGRFPHHVLRRMSGR